MTPLLNRLDSHYSRQQRCCHDPYRVITHDRDRLECGTCGTLWQGHHTRRNR